MAKDQFFAAAPNAGEVDLNKAQVENVAEPTQGSTNPLSPDDTVTSDEEATDATGEQVPANTEATDGGDADAPTASKGDEATTDTSDSDTTPRDGKMSAGQDEQGQATSGASPEEQKGDKKKSGKKAKNNKKLTLDYTDEEKKQLKVVTNVFNAEIERVIADPNFFATPFNDGKNAIVDITQAVLTGAKKVASFAENRIHGRDEKTTGESLMTYYPQHPLIIITDKMAEAAGLTRILLPNDKSGSLTDRHVIIPLDGGGRLNYLMTIEPEKWPPLFGVFPTADMNGYYNLRKLLEIINTQVKTWDTSNFLIKRIMEEDEKGRERWQSIQNLLHKGYNYQAACELMTLKTDRISKSGIINGKTDDVFVHHKYADDIYKALVSKFGEGDDKTLKTKMFPAEISRIWGKLRDQAGVKKATEHFILFINQLTTGQVQEIASAKSKEVGGATISKDQHRISLLKKAFNDFMKKNPLN